MNAIARVIGRDLRLALRQPGDAASVLVFFVVAAVLFPFGVGPEPNVLARIAAGVVWVTGLLAAMLSFDRLFAADYEDGSLEQLALLPVTLEIVVLGKVIAHWLTTGLPILVIAPVLAVMLNLDPSGLLPLVIVLALGMPTISFIGALGAALTLGARRGGVLLALLVLPLLIPVLIFGAAAVDAGIAGFGIRSHVLILTAMALAALVLTPWVAAAAIRQALE